VPRDSYVAVEANRYPVPLEWAGQTVEVRILAQEVWIRCAGAEPVCHSRLLGKHQVARWQGPPRQLPPREPSPPAGPPRWDPAFLVDLGEVSLRPLECYEAAVEEVRA